MDKKISVVFDSGDNDFLFCTPEQGETLAEKVEGVKVIFTGSEEEFLNNYIPFRNNKCFPNDVCVFLDNDTGEFLVYETFEIRRRAIRTEGLKMVFGGSYQVFQENWDRVEGSRSLVIPRMESAFIKLPNIVIHEDSFRNLYAMPAFAHESNYEWLGTYEEFEDNWIKSEYDRVVPREREEQQKKPVLGYDASLSLLALSDFTSASSSMNFADRASTVEPMSVCVSSCFHFKFWTSFSCLTEREDRSSIRRVWFSKILF